jgi:TupA-like ATPgrasp
VIARLKKYLKRSQLLVDTRRKLSQPFRVLLFRFSPVLVAKYNYFSKRWRLPDLKKPKTFDEKLLWLMLYWKDRLKVQCADKYAVRGYVTENGFSDILPPLIGIYVSAEDIHVSALPNQFALKCTHGCGFNILCQDKSALDWPRAQKKLKKWLHTDISKLNGEIHYSEIKPRIVCEPYLTGNGGSVLDDYKFFCFSGKVHCVMVCTGRGSKEGPKFDFYDAEWSNKLPYSRSGIVANRQIPRAQCYTRMLEAAEALSRPFPFVRVDFYEVNGKAVFGEMTFTPSGCVDPGYTEFAQKILGDLVKLPGEQSERDLPQCAHTPGLVQLER